jgi:transcriptional regulator with XRE-family HTH domain
MPKLTVDEKTAVSNIVSAVRSSAGMTQRDFGSRIGVKPKQVGRYESAKAVPSKSTLKKIFHVGWKLAVPLIERLPYYTPAVLTWEVINEIKDAVKKEHEQEEQQKARIEEITSAIAEQTEAACKAREEACNDERGNIA